MSDLAPRLFFDYVDPCSWVLELRVRSLEAELGVEAARHPLELVPPPHSLLDPEGDAYRERLERARAAAPEHASLLRPPPVVPWSRKAHELVLHAREHGVGRDVHDALFRAFHEEGRDIGRVDVLLDIAVAAGLDPTDTKAVLDVDRHLEAVRQLRAVAERLAIPGVPTLLAGDRVLQGVPGVDQVRAALAAGPSHNPTSS